MANQRQLIDDLFFDTFMTLAEHCGLDEDQLNEAFDRFVDRLPALRQIGKADYGKELLLGMMCCIGREYNERLAVEFAPEDEEEDGETVTLHYPGCNIEIPMHCMCDELKREVNDVMGQHRKMFEAVLAKYGVAVEHEGDGSDDDSVFLESGPDVEEAIGEAIDRIQLPPDTEGPPADGCE